MKGVVCEGFLIGIMAGGKGSVLNDFVVSNEVCLIFNGQKEDVSLLLLLYYILFSIGQLHDVRRLPSCVEEVFL